MDLLYFIPALRIILGVLFVITAGLKLPDLKGFAVIVATYNILPRQFVKPAAYMQPFFELVIGFWILSGKYLLYSSTAGLLLMLVADIFVLKGLMAKKKMENCGCYGTAIKIPLNWKKFVENLIWTALLVILIIAAYQAMLLGFT
jgi:hypothetical protein